MKLAVWAIATQTLAQSFMRYDTSECIGVWGPSEYLGEKASLSVEIKPHVASGSVAVAIFNSNDRFDILASAVQNDYIICSPEDVAAKTCRESELGKFHLKTNTSRIINEIMSWQLLQNASNSNTAKDVYKLTPSKLVFNVNSTGFYCIFLAAQGFKDSVDFDSVFVVKNPYGLLPALFYPALPFYLTFSILYTIVGIGWMTLSFLYWKDLLPIQHYVSAVIAFLIVEMAFNYGFFSDYNNKGTICIKID
jgi:hypothetical protein